MQNEEGAFNHRESILLPPDRPSGFPVCAFRDYRSTLNASAMSGRSPSVSLATAPLSGYAPSTRSVAVSAKSIVKLFCSVLAFSGFLMMN
jgi:hypothetical protein